MSASSLNILLMLMAHNSLFTSSHTIAHPQAFVLQNMVPLLRSLSFLEPTTPYFSELGPCLSPAPFARRPHRNTLEGHPGGQACDAQWGGLEGVQGAGLGALGRGLGVWGFSGSGV